MAFDHHDAAIIPFNDTTCQTTLENGTKCSQQHCHHVEDVCELSDEDSFRTRYCGGCRMQLFHSLRAKTEEMRQEKIKKAKETGKDYFTATGFKSGTGDWQYEHVNSSQTFWDRNKPVTEEIIQACGDRWIKNRHE
ncbi:Hypothetical predicted protein [Paramuricea clavata]|uniref:Uncharacterized protein n=1 Tax=Paramuricea clavata TaxID=317549 RepID=A0A6S7GES9_PARCT|nr:Hypothetical predicted protein [Paramuricea clavata]